MYKHNFYNLRVDLKHPENYSMDDIMDIIDNFDIFINPSDEYKFVLTYLFILKDCAYINPNTHEFALYKEPNSSELLKVKENLLDLIDALYDYDYAQLQKYIREKKYFGKTNLKDYLKQMTKVQTIQLLRTIILYGKRLRIFYSKPQLTKMFAFINNHVPTKYKVPSPEAFSILSKDKICEAICYCDLTPELLDGVAEKILNARSIDEGDVAAQSLIESNYLSMFQAYQETKKTNKGEN